ncbi:DUF4199 domain-containing protein [Flavitalea antarctica]
MKKTITVFGLIAGGILSVFLFASAPFMKHVDADSMTTSMFINYTVQLLTFSLIFFAVRQYRENYNNGAISFARAFKIGLWISLIGSAFYVVTWAIIYNFVVPDFMDTMCAAQVESAIKNGASASEIAAIRQQIADGKEMYSTWYGFAAITMLEIFPTGLLVSLVSALILRRNRKEAD